MDFGKTKEGSQTISRNAAAIGDIAEAHPQTVTAVTEIKTGVGLSTNKVNNIIVSTGTIKLYANLVDILDVKSVTPAQDQVLTYSGTSWMPKAFSGTDIASFSALDQTPATMEGHGGKIVNVNAAGTDLEYVNPDSIIKVYGGEGIAHYPVESNRNQKVGFDSGKFDTTTLSKAGDRALVRLESGQTKLIRFDKINLSNLDNSGSCFKTLNSFTGGYGMSYGIVNGLGCFQFLPAAIPANDFNTGGICGVLNITHGGTSGSTIATAQDSLELFPNKHILARSGPSFRGVMYGVDINLMPDTFGLCLTYSGKGYATDDPNLILYNPADLSDNFSISVGFFNSGGSVGQILSSITGRMNNFHDDGICVYNLFGQLAGGTSAKITVTPQINYMTFGPAPDATIGLSSAIGFRNYYGDVQLRASRTTNGASHWRSIFPLNMIDIDDVKTGAFSTNDILIYTGTCFSSYNMSGHGSMTGAAVFSLNIPDEFIGGDKLNTLGLSVSNANLSYLSGLSSNIQAQFANKIGLSPPGIVADGDMVYYDNSGTCWRPLRAPAGAAGTSMIIYNNSSGKPEWGHPGTIFGASGSSPSLTRHRIGYFEPNLPGYTMTVKNIMDGVVKLQDGDAAGASTGLRVDGNGHMLITYNNLNLGTSMATNDLISYHGQVAANGDFITAITKENLAKTLSGEGLSAAAGNIRFNYDGVSLPYFRFKDYSTATAPSASGISGRMIYVNDGHAGAACMAVSYDNTWKRIIFGDTISAT